MTLKLTSLLPAICLLSLMVVGAHAETDREKRAAKFKADRGLLIEEHQLGMDVKAGKLSSDEYKRRKVEAQDRAKKLGVQ